MTGTRVLDLGQLGFDRGAHILVQRELLRLARGEALAVRGAADGLAAHLRAWARAMGHEFEAAPGLAGVVRAGPAAAARWRGAERAGSAAADGAVAAAPLHWGLAARGALVEAGMPAFAFALAQKDEVWADDPGALYRQAAAAQWDPETAIPWAAAAASSGDGEDALVQVLTYLIENETAAALVPARFCAQTHPHYREVLQLLAIQAADEARHIEVFTRRAAMRRGELGTSTVGGQASLKTLVDEPDFALASFLLSVLGEGSFLHLLGFLHVHAPDPCTAEIMRLAAQDESRHVAFGMAHLQRHGARDATLRSRLALAIERRHDALRHTAGLDQNVFDALVVLAARGFAPEAIAGGHAAVAELVQQMDAGRRARLRKLGFEGAEAAALSALHTRNFM